MLTTEELSRARVIQDLISVRLRLRAAATTLKLHHARLPSGTDNPHAAHNGQAALRRPAERLREDARRLDARRAARWPSALLLTRLSAIALSFLSAAFSSSRFSCR